MTGSPSGSPPERSGEPGWQIVAKVAAFVAVPIAMIYLIKLLLG